MSGQKAKLTCYGGVGAVTGANFLFEIGSKKILIDCGLLQGVMAADEINGAAFDYDPQSIDILFITHAHIDHIGKVPKLIKDGFTGTIYSTPETKSIAELMLRDTARITEENARTEGVEPLYTRGDAEKALSIWQTIPYHEVRDFDDLSSSGNEFSVELFDAGHILGSAMYKFIFPSGKSMLFTGDLGNSPSPLLRDTELVTDATYMLIDSVYGDRNHEDKSERDSRFKEVVQDVIERKGTLIIPVFSLERTQVILYELDNLFESKALPSIPVFLDSPLGIHVTEIYSRITKHYNEAVQEEIRGGDSIFKFPKLRQTVSSRDSREIKNLKGPKIILAGSGMSTAGRILNHEAEYLPDPDATLLLVGYQAPGTLGRELWDGAKKVQIKNEEVPVRARIEMINGYSAHKDSNGLVDFVSKSSETLKKVFIAMGEMKSSIFLAQRIHDELGINAVVPERGKTYELEI